MTRNELSRLQDRLFRSVVLALEHEVNDETDEDLTLVDILCTREHHGAPVRPVLVASTATVRRARAQVQQVFARDLTVFPPPLLDAGCGRGERKLPRSVEVREDAAADRRHGRRVSRVRACPRGVDQQSSVVAGGVFSVD